MKETTESFLKMSILNAIITLREYHSMYPSKTIDEIVGIIQSLGTYKSSYDYKAAQIALCNLDITEVNNLRELIALVVMHESPSWLYQVQFGREIVASCLRDNEQYDILQCLESAGLYAKEPDSSIVQWWDHLAGIVRSSENDSKLKSGRTGELLTLEYERKRLVELNAKPRWVSIENNFAGYDVLSYDESSSGIKQKMIEVKACKSRPLAFYISKNEWNSALNFGDNYVFHIWYLPKHKLIELRVSDVEKNIPINMGSGEWQTVLIDIDPLFERCTG
jgi:hypothetical protein